VLPLCCSAFFRPPEAFAALEAWVMEDLLDRALTERPVRIWTPGCGYGRQPNVTIFATDSEANSIRVARAGVYCDTDLRAVSAARLPPEGRTRLYSLLHFALNQGGHLLLRGAWAC
jgi:chemotaxis methyl-accepting protein methylase